MGGRKSYNPKNKGKKSYHPLLTFLVETREYLAGELRNGDRPTGKQIAAHLGAVLAALLPGVKQIFARADSGILLLGSDRGLSRSRLVEQLRQAAWKPSADPDAEAECEFRY
jgi:hypothetical protein